MVNQRSVGNSLLNRTENGKYFIEERGSGGWPNILVELLRLEGANYKPRFVENTLRGCKVHLNWALEETRTPNPLSSPYFWTLPYLEVLAFHIT
jgi:hypothetical protein